MKKRYALIGYPVGHSLSPYMHNAAFKSLGIDAEYELIEVKPHDLEGFFSGFRRKLNGANVTIPHKVEAQKYVDRINDIAAGIGAINTVVITGDELVGYNTDALGFLRSLKEDLGFEPAGKNVIIFGAGGAARAVSYILYTQNAKRIILTDIARDRAALLAGELGRQPGCDVTAVQYDKDIIGELVLNSDLLVNASPCGMKKDDPPLVDELFLHNKLSVFDLIYNPGETPLLKAAGERGIKAVNGLCMLICQGAESFRLWTGKEPPVDVMKNALKDAIKGNR